MPYNNQNNNNFDQFPSNNNVKSSSKNHSMTGKQSEKSGNFEQFDVANLEDEI